MVMPPSGERAEDRPVVVLGHGGMLAHALVRVLEKQGVHYVPLDEKTLDITSGKHVDVLIKDINPRVVINAAAYTDVDGAEAHEDAAFEINGIGAGNVASAAALIGASVVHVSTDYVFNGRKSSPYSPHDPVEPLSVYGKSKLKGELLVRKHNPEHIIVRTAWLYGPNGKNFVTTMLKLGRDRGSLDVVEDQRGAPTYTRHLAGGILGLMNRKAFGTCHLTNSGQCSWYEFAVEIFRHSCMNVNVRPIFTESYPRPAPRPRNSVLDCTTGYDLLGGPLPAWQEALREYLTEIGEKN